MRSNNIGSIFILGLTGSLLLSGCGTFGAPTDESDLQQVANYYYQPGKSDKLIHATLHDFLSEKSKDLITFEDWDKSDDADATQYAASVSLLGPKNNAGQTYQVISVREAIPDKDGKKHRMTYSDTWMMESGKWRRLSFLQAKADYEKAFQGGDFQTAQSKAQDWLTLNPYSIEAEQSLGYAMVRLTAADSATINALLDKDEILMDSGAPSGDYNAMKNYYASIGSNMALLEADIDDPVGPKLNEIVNEMVAINPNDTITFFCVSNWYQSVDSKKEYYLKLKETVTDPDDIFDLASSINDMHFRFDFLYGIKETPAVFLLELEAYAVQAESGNLPAWWELYHKFMANKGSFNNIKPALDNMASSDAANWAGKIGDLLFNSKDYDYAQQLLDYGNNRDSDDPQVKLLAHDLGTLKK